MSFAHFDETGRARMIDVSGKAITPREAVARGFVRMEKATLAMLKGESPSRKGDPLAVAQLAGMMAAKRTGELIPLCHPLGLSAISVDLVVDDEAGGVQIQATVRTAAQTGVEMEALTAVSVAALTVYDMCKAVDKGMVIEAIRLVEKRGGKSGHYVRPGDGPLKV